MTDKELELMNLIEAVKMLGRLEIIAGELDTFQVWLRFFKTRFSGIDFRRLAKAEKLTSKRVADIRELATVLEDFQLRLQDLALKDDALT